VRVVEAQKEYTESRFKHYLMTLQEEKLKWEDIVEKQ
jgi:hypothetical protein